jgi:hypothetical protein
VVVVTLAAWGVGDVKAGAASKILVNRGNPLHPHVVAGVFGGRLHPAPFSQWKGNAEGRYPGREYDTVSIFADSRVLLATPKQCKIFQQ